MPTITDPPITYTASPTGGAAPFEYKWDVIPNTGFVINNGVTLGTYQNSNQIIIDWNVENTYTIHNCVRETNNPTCETCFDNNDLGLLVSVTSVNTCDNCTVPFGFVTGVTYATLNTTFCPACAQSIPLLAIGTSFFDGPSAINGNGAAIPIDLVCGTLDIIGPYSGYTVDSFNNQTGLTFITPTSTGIHTISWRYMCTLSGQFTIGSSQFEGYVPYIVNTSCSLISGNVLCDITVHSALVSGGPFTVTLNGGNPQVFSGSNFLYSAPLSGTGTLLITSTSGITSSQQVSNSCVGVWAVNRCTFDLLPNSSQNEYISYNGALTPGQFIQLDYCSVFEVQFFAYISNPILISFNNLEISTYAFGCLRPLNEIINVNIVCGPGVGFKTVTGRILGFTGCITYDYVEDIGTYQSLLVTQQGDFSVTVSNTTSSVSIRSQLGIVWGTYTQAINVTVPSCP